VLSKGLDEDHAALIILQKALCIQFEVRDLLISLIGKLSFRKTGGHILLQEVNTLQLGLKSLKEFQDLVGTCINFLGVSRVIEEKFEECSP
jgi:hypothetical protein